MICSTNMLWLTTFHISNTIPSGIRNIISCMLKSAWGNNLEKNPCATCQLFRAKSKTKSNICKSGEKITLDSDWINKENWIFLKCSIQLSPSFHLLTLPNYISPKSKENTFSWIQKHSDYFPPSYQPRTNMAARLEINCWSFENMIHLITFITRWKYLFLGGS